MIWDVSDSVNLRWKQNIGISYISVHVNLKINTEKTSGFYENTASRVNDETSVWRKTLCCFERSLMCRIVSVMWPSAPDRYITTWMSIKSVFSIIWSWHDETTATKEKAFPEHVWSQTKRLMLLNIFQCEVKLKQKRIQGFTRLKTRCSVLIQVEEEEEMERWRVSEM